MLFMKGDNSPSIRKDDLLTMPFKLPTLTEQQEIVRILDSVLEKEADAKETAERVLERIALLKKSILARAFRGEL
jgi:type I restriction enzyme S subunit